MARRLRHVLKDHLHTSQFCGVPGNSILEAASLVRDAIAYSESSGPRLCVLTLDFQHAFDRVSITTSFKSYTDMASANGSSRGYTPYTKTPQPQFKLTGLWRAHAHPKFSAASLSIKYDIICTLPAPPSSHTRRQPAGHQTRPRYAEAPPPTPSRRVRLRCNRPCNPTWRFHDHPRGHAMLRKIHRIQAQLTEIEGPSHCGVVAASDCTRNVSLTTKSRSWGSHMEPLLQNR